MQLQANANLASNSKLATVTPGTLAGALPANGIAMHSRDLAAEGAIMDQPSSTEAPERPTSQPELRRVMGPKLLLLFIVGDILGTGIYAVTGNVANQVGGVVWLPF